MKDLKSNSWRLHTFFLVLALLFGRISVAQKSDKPLRLFVIGNSFSQNATSYLPEIARSRNKKLEIGRAELGGHSLAQHWSYVAAAEANPEDPKGKPYGGKSLKTLLSDGVWDVITIQQYSYLSGDSASYSPYAGKLYAFIKKLQPKAKILIHQTWAYRVDAKKFGQIGTNTLAKDQEEMWMYSRAAYHHLAKVLHAKILPVGDAFQQVNTDPNMGFKVDSTFNYEHPEYPNLPNQKHSLNVGYSWNKKTLAFDPNHASAAGRYLGGLIWYAILFKDSPKKVTFVPKEVDTDFAAYLKNIAAKHL